MFRMLIASVFVLPVAFAACGNNNTVDADAFATYQMCFDEHTTMESLSPHDAFVVCCLDHPIGPAPGVHPSCGDTAAACVALIDGTDPVHNLTGATKPSTADVMTFCQDYITQKGM